MNRFFSGVVKHRRPVLLIFVLLTIVAFGAWRQVAVNYDMNDYLPDSAPSTVSLNEMRAAFAGDIPNARVMVSDVSVPEALRIKEQLQAVDGVTEVLWLDDSVDLTVPLSMLDADAVEGAYQNNAALFTLTIQKEKRIAAVAAIRDLLGDRGALTGSAVSTAVATTSTVNEIYKISAIAVAFVLLVLLLTTDSWLEPLIVLLGLGVAIVLNNGSNLLFGEISFVTNAAGSILQLALSLDYSVFLIHRFEECRATEPDPEKAMTEALCRSAGSILSSGLTTVIGFLALILMQFRIGPDLGIALAKGTAISLLTVFLFTPSLVLLTHRGLERTRHRPLYPSFKGFGRFVSRVTVPLVCVFALLVVPAYLASGANDYYYGASHIFGEDTRLGQDTARIEDTFGVRDTYVLMVPRGDTATEAALSREIRALPQVSGIVSFVDNAGAMIPYSYPDADTLAQLESADYSRLVLSVATRYEGAETFELVEAIRALADKYYPAGTYLAGEGVSTYDLMDTVTGDMVKVNLLAIGAAFLVLLLTMRSVCVPFLLVIAIETAIWLNLAVPYFGGSTVFYIAYLIISSIQLGATVDYAILTTDRYRENRQTLDKRAAVVQTTADTAVSVMTSGSVLAAVGLLLGSLSTNRLLAQLGLFVGRGALFSLGIVLFVLPGLLLLFDRLVRLGEKHQRERRAIRHQDRRRPRRRNGAACTGSGGDAHLLAKAAAPVRIVLNRAKAPPHGGAFAV